MNANSKKNPRRVVAVEVCHTRLHMALRETGDRGTVRILTDSIVWRKEAATLHTATGAAELTTALRELVTRYRLTGLPLEFTLSGDYCVTRVVTGTTERVRQELQHLEQRSLLYLWLGHGPKALAASIRQIDARHQHALLTVVNQRSRDTLVEVAQRVGLLLRLVEPSLVSLCRLVGHMKGDQEEPALIVSMGEQGVELGISYQGQLLLDYRPSSQEARTEVGATIQRHLSRLQRYCGRYVGFAKGNLTRIYLCGEPDAVALVAKDLQQHEALHVQLLDVTQIDPNWEFPGEPPGTDLCPAVGTTLIAATGGEQGAGPNLIERLRSGNNQSLSQALTANLWPVAAALLITLGMWGGVWHQGNVKQQLQQQLDQYASAQRETRLLSGRMLRDRKHMNLLETINEQISPFHWQEITTAISQCLPNDVWLEGVTLEGDGQLRLQGAAYAEDGIFEFVHWLEKLPAVRKVAIGTTQPARFQNGPGTRFTVHCDVVDYNDERDGKSRES